MTAPRPLTVPDHERKARIAAIAPASSVFVTANAGSGKTTILTNRVIRLLLEGTDPAAILCLTYTKAAAAEMQNRIFDTLAAWVRMDEAKLAAAIEELTGRRPDARGLAQARNLFARAVEAPGGLKLQTIHAFAERLLHLFPFEANVPVRFAVLDEAGQSDLLGRARAEMIAAAIATPASALGQAFHSLSLLLGEDDLAALITAGLRPMRRLRPGVATHDERRALIAAAVELDPGVTRAMACRDLLAGDLGRSCWPRAIAALEPLKRKKTDDTFKADLARALAEDDEAAAWSLIGIVMTADGSKPRDRVLTGDVLAAVPWLADEIERARTSVPVHLDRLRLIEAVERSADLMTLLDDILGRFRAAKRVAALVDFDDIILEAGRLVAEGAAWVLHKLDGGIDHVLIDEAQDTTPEMWEIARALTAEFFAGEGARRIIRSVFAVGDEKQSIYSFQGARPIEFETNRRHFARLAEKADLAFANPALNLSFRTVGDVLAAVDRVFSVPAHSDGLAADNRAPVHETARRGAPGFVELWPPEVNESATPSDPWQEVDAIGRRSGEARLAVRIARHIRHSVDHDRYEDDGKRVTPGDVLVLVQRRKAFFSSLIRELKREGLPVAGVDRMLLTEQQGVLDLVAAARAALMPEDDLTLATALKSPLVGFDDADLIALCPDRPGSLYAALAASGEPRHQTARATVETWRKLASTRAPHDFFKALLAPLGGRKALQARLGHDAAEAIDLFLDQMRARELREPASLAAAIAAFERSDTDIKRDQEQAGGRVRVLTVHGAKGLEARSVYLADTQRLPNFKQQVPLFARAVGSADQQVLFWAGGARTGVPQVGQRLKAEQRADLMREYRRLLYVAMTRARDRLYVAAWGAPDKIAGESWYGMIEATLGPAMQSVPEATGAGEVRRFRTVETGAAPPAAEPEAPEPPEALPDWIARHVPVEASPLPPLRPSGALQAAERITAPEREAARERGDLIHALIERLGDWPAADRAALATRFLANRSPGMPTARREELTRKVLALAAAPAVAPLFGPQAQAEVAVAGAITTPDGRSLSVSGRIDRLLVEPGRVLVVDFKTGRRPSGGVPTPAHLLQLALYRALLQDIYPDRPVAAALIWTGEARFDEVPAAALDAAITLL
jgi:ATP-dependent helicase/nuclease subunit A